MADTQKPGNASQDDDTKSLTEARENSEQPAGEFETEHDGVKPDVKEDNAKRR